MAALDCDRSELVEQLGVLQRTRADQAAESTQVPAPLTMASPSAKKLALFRDLFRGRDDIFPRRWENPSMGKSAYAPIYGNEWIRRLCGKPQVKRGECPNQAFLPSNEKATLELLQR